MLNRLRAAVAIRTERTTGGPTANRPTGQTVAGAAEYRGRHAARYLSVEAERDGLDVVRPAPRHALTV